MLLHRGRAAKLQKRLKYGCHKFFSTLKSEMAVNTVYIYIYFSISKQHISFDKMHQIKDIFSIF